ncbi:Aste57867_932 [Aphanomyces stellatus]|uniref:Aste57867_932 protein n=1 Tax=Aphanomyces stellatus TaxID=120398 RepID=A0A485K548_9STRA|nr:hypothetical protein As57867_000931 [Aphanomyces stellatus]VFT78155.1 Aste57867_932 [Aphanomyces stellatus]
MEACKEFVVEDKKTSTYADVMWFPGVSQLFGLDTMHRLLLTDTSADAPETQFKYVPPLFLPQAIGLEIDSHTDFDSALLESLLFRRRSTYLDSVVAPSTESSHSSMDAAASRAQQATRALHDPSTLFSKEPVHLDVEEDIYVSQSILVSLLLGSSLSDERRPIVQDVVVSHTKLLLEAFAKRVEKRWPIDTLGHLVYASLYGGLVALLQANDAPFATRIALECLPLLQKVNHALQPMAQSLLHADRLEMSPTKPSMMGPGKRHADDMPPSSALVAARIPLKRQKTMYREPDVQLHYAQAIKIMLDNVHNTITGSSTDILNPSGLLNWDQSDSTSASLMTYFDLSFQAANELAKASKRNSFAAVLVFVAENPTRLPTIQCEMEMECIKTSLSLLFELQMTITNVQLHDEPVQVLHPDVQQKLTRSKGAMAVLLSLGWTVNTTGWYHLEYLAGAPHKMQEASQLIAKYIALCQTRLGQLTQTHQVLLLQTSDASATSKVLPMRLDFRCPLTHQVYATAADLTRHANNLEPWLKCMVYCRMKKLFWYSPYSSQPQGNLHYPSYSSCRLEVQAASDLLWVRHPFYLYHASLRLLICMPKPTPFPEDFLYGLPHVRGQVHFAAAAVYPTELMVVHSLVPFVADDRDRTQPWTSFLHNLMQGRDDGVWIKRLGPLQSRSPERMQLERKVVGLALLASGLLPQATTNSDCHAWNRLQKEFQSFRQWLHQHCQQSTSTLENLGHWVTFLLQQLAGPDIQLWTSGDAVEYIVHQVFAFLKRVHDTKLTLSVQQGLMIQRRTAWLEMIGLTVLEKHLAAQCPILPTCQVIAIASLATMFQTRSASTLRYGQTWSQLLEATHAWSRVCDTWTVESLYRLWRQPMSRVAQQCLRDRPAASGALQCIFRASTVSTEAWSTALFLTLDCLRTQTTHVLSLLLDQFHMWLGQSAKDVFVLRGHRLVALGLEHLAKEHHPPTASSSLPAICTLICTHLPRFAKTTQEQLIHGLHILLPLIPPDPVLFEFLVVLAAMHQDAMLPAFEPHVEDKQVMIKPTTVYADTVPALALRAARRTLVVWSMASTIESWLPTTLDGCPNDPLAHLRGIGSLMLLAQDCSKLVLGHSLRMTRDDIVPATEGILLSFTRDDTMRAMCRALFRSRSAATPYHVVQCTAGLLSFPCDTPLDLEVPPVVVPLVDAAPGSSFATVVSNWCFKVWLRRCTNESSLDPQLLTQLLDIALKPFFFPLPRPPLLSPDTALQPETYWRVEGIYRHVLHQLGCVQHLEYAFPQHALLSGFNPPPSMRDVLESGPRAHSSKRPPLTPSRILTRDNMKRIAALDNATCSTPAELIKLAEMGFSKALSTYVLKYYPHNVPGACQWLLNESNLEDIHRIAVLQPRIVDYGSPFSTHFRLNSNVKESILLACASTSRELLHVLREVPRESFVPSLYEKEVELDSAIAHPLGYTLPSMFQCLQVLEALSLEPGLRILDIGTGSGYFVTLLARLMGENASITSWEQDADRLAYAFVYMAQSVQDGQSVIYPKFMESIRFEVCNAFLNDHEGATFDRVHVGASCPTESVDLLLQYVALHGILVVPIDGTLYRIHKTQNTNDWRALTVEAIGTYSIESLTAPSLETLSKSKGQGLHGFEEQTRTKLPNVLTLNEVAEHKAYEYPVEVNMLFCVKSLSKSSQFQQGRSDAGFVVTRVGTMPVQLKELSMGVKISDASLRVSNRGSFGTACANVCVRGGGVWFYEVRIGTSKVIQIGWILPGFDPNPESGLGVGDDLCSYAYDGRRKKKWHNGVSDEYCKQSCKAGDVVGCLLDLDQGIMSFLLNGAMLGVAYSDLPREFPVGGYTPACSMDGGESVWFNFGVKPFLYPPSQTFCPLAHFQSPPLLGIPSDLPPVLVAKQVHFDAVYATGVDDADGSVMYHIPHDKIIPVDHALSAYLHPHGRSRSTMNMELLHDLRIAMARSFLAAHQADLSPPELAAYLGQASECPRLKPEELHVPTSQLAWMVDAMLRQLESASDSLIVEESRHPISHRLMSLTPTVIMALKTLRTSLLDVEAQMEKGNSKAALLTLQRATESVLSRTERESGDHFQRCRSQLETTYQRIRSASSDYAFPETPNYDRRPTLEKVSHLRQALELFESQVSFPSRVPVEAIHGKYVGLPEALSLKVEFDPRTLRTNWKLLFFADAACHQRWPWVLSRDGFAPFIVPANHFYYSFLPDTSKNHFMPEWGYAFRVTPYVFHPQRTTSLGWSLWTVVQKQPSLQDNLIQSIHATSWLQGILRYVRTPAAPEKVQVLSTLVLCLHRNRSTLSPDLQPILSQFLWYLLPELNLLYRQSAKWKLHSNPYFQTLLQTMTTLSTVVHTRIQRYGVHVFGYHADMHLWHQDLLETVDGLDVMQPSIWQPIVAKQYNPLHMLKQLFKQFESSIKSDVQRWHKNRRELWIRQVDQAYHPALLSHCLCVFNETLLPGAREGNWTSERNKWLRHLQAACTVGDIAMQLMVLAGFIDVDSHSSSWSCQSLDWRKAVMSLTKTDLSEDGQLHVAGHWTDGVVVSENDGGGSVVDRMFEDSPKLFRVRQSENVHVIGAFEYKRSLIRKIQFRLRKTYTNNNTPCTAGMVFVFPDYPTPEDMMKIQHYDYFTSDQYQTYVYNMRRQAMLPMPGDPVGYFDVSSPHYCQGNAVTIVPDFAILGQYVVVKLLKCYNIRVMEELADVIKHQEEHTPDIYFNMNSVYLWCYKSFEEWLIYPSDVEYMIESKYQSYCSGDIVCHSEFMVAGQDVVLDFQQMVQYTPTDHYANPITCRIKRVNVTVDMKIKLTAHHCMEVEYVGFYGLQDAAAEEAYNNWKVKYQTVCMAAQQAPPPTQTKTELYRVLSEKSPVYSFPGLNSPISTYVLYGEIVSITRRHLRWGCIANSEAWCLLDSHQPSFFPISHARAAAHGSVPWLPDEPVFSVPPNGEAYSGVLQSGASREVDEELVHMVNKLRETSGRCVTNLMVSDIYISLHGKHKDYPYLSIFPIPAITGRLDMLRAINSRMGQFLMFIGIGLPLKQPDWLSGIVIQAKSCLFLETKMQVWKKIWGESYSTERSSEVVSINRHIAFKARDALRESANTLQDDLSVYYPTVFVQLWRELQRTPPGLLRRSDGKSWFTKFKGEPSIDDGGLYRETTATTCYELNNGLLPLFVLCSNGKHAQGLNQNTLVPNSSCTKWHECCEWLEFVGVLMGIATQNLEEVFPLQLAAPIWKLLVSEPLTPSDFQQFDVATAQTLRYLRHTDFDDDDMFASIFPDQTFTCVNEQDELVELIPNGASIVVTLENRLAYADALEQYRLHQFDEAVSYILKGLRSIIQVDLLPMFTWSEFELLVCGRPTLNLSLLRKKTEYSPDMDMHDTLVERFWRTLARFSSDEQQLFLQFVWGRSRLPFSEVDFGSYTFKLVRHMSPANPDEYLPVAHTCFFQLELPNYSSDEIMRTKLLYAMNHCTSIVDEEQAAQQREIALWDS